MNRVLVGCLVAVAMGCGAGVEERLEVEASATAEKPIRYDQQLADLLPMLPGNHWELAGLNSDSQIRVEERTETGVRFSGLTRSGDLWLNIDEHAPNTILALNLDSEQWGPFLRLDRRSWVFRASNAACDRFRVTRLDDQMVATGVGQFSAKAFRFEVLAPANVRCEAPAFDKLLLSQDVGPVTVVAAGAEATLQHAMIKDTVLHHTMMPTALLMEQTEFVNKANTIRCVTQPCPTNEVTATAKFALTVTNAEAHMHQCEFRTGKQQDFELINHAGEVVKAWSDGRSFLKEPTAIAFDPGQRRSLEGELELTDRNGVQLDGTYTVRASMFGHDQHALPALGTIVVKVTR